MNLKIQNFYFYYRLSIWNRLQTTGFTQNYKKIKNLKYLSEKMTLEFLQEMKIFEFYIIPNLNNNFMNDEKCRIF